MSRPMSGLVFGGGYDLTPCYPEDEDVRFWHQAAKDAVGDHYQPFKETCDDYFFLSHRGETRGVGGIFSMIGQRVVSTTVLP